MNPPTSFQNYEALLSKVDDFFTALNRDYPEDINCKHGCTECCIDGLTLCKLEFDYIKSKLSDAFFAGPASPDNNDSPCPLLDVNGGCMIYEYRPLVCRLWGMPLYYKESSTASNSDTLTSCHKNFLCNITLDKLPISRAINASLLTETLCTLNILYCKILGADPNERSTVKEIFNHFLQNH